jgi:N-acetylglucosaminyl-diphospho-decaprenol L-rhamnosyltransferase
MDLSIVIVNWNSIEFVRECIDSIRTTATTFKYEIIVVDNASQEDACRALELQSIRVVYSRENIGFARANNLGAGQSSSTNILFLNPDTVVLGDALERMLRVLNSAPDIAAVGCRLLNADMTLQTSCVQPFPSIANQLLSIDWFKRRWPRLPLWGARPLFSDTECESTDVDSVSGACLMMKRAVFEKVKGFSTEYFMYAEELDLCRKIRQSGWRVCYVGDAQVIHFGGKSTEQAGASLSDVMMRDSVYRLLKKFCGHNYAKVYRALLLVSAGMRLVLLLPCLLLPKKMIDKDYIRSTVAKWAAIASWAVMLHPRDTYIHKRFVVSGRSSR